MQKKNTPILLIILALVLLIGGLYTLLPKQISQPINIELNQIMAYSDIEEHISTTDKLQLQIPRHETTLYPDSLTQKYSTVESFKIKSQSIQMITHMKKAHPWAYAGFTVFLGDTLTGKDCPNWSQFDKLEVTMDSPNSEGLHIQVNGYVPEEQRHHPQEFNRMTQTAIPNSQTTTSYSIDLKTLFTPLWWKRNQKIPFLDNQQHFEKVCSFGFSQSFDLMKKPGLDTLNIYQLKLSGEKPGSFTLGLLLIGMAITFLIVPILKPESFGIIAETKASKIELKDIQQELNERIKKYYEQNYMLQEDSTQDFAHAIGLHSKKLQETLRTQFQITHKAWINHLRIEEAKRLLKETDAMVGNIADAVGFRTPSHFNRVFKEKTGLSPKDFRET